jgi:N-formylglutamate amidohydrolase
MVNRELKDIIDYLSPAHEIVSPAGNETPFIFSSPHSGRIYPQGFIRSSRLSPLALRSSEDAYVDELFGHVAGQGAHFIHARFPRAYLDLNRHPFELDPKLFVGQLPPFALADTIKVKSGLGVIARVVSEGRHIYRGPLDLKDALTRVHRLYYPYHAALRGLLRSCRSRFRHAVLIDCHSMPSSGVPGHLTSRPDIVVGDRHGKSCDPALTALFCGELERLGFRVALNTPYAGGYVTDEYGRPQEGVHALQVEINRALYLDEERVEKTGDFAGLQARLAQLTATLIRDFGEPGALPLAAE